MAALHVVNKADALGECMGLLTAEDVLVLIEDGVYAACGKVGLRAPCYALKDDLEARGLLARIDSAVAVLSYDGFVELVEYHQPIVTWSR